MTTTHLLYLHGFRSSPQSTKARQTARWITAHRPGVRWCCPQLPPSPRAAIVLDWREMAQRYAGCRIKLLEGGDHALSDYEAQHLPEVLRFLGLA